MAPFLVLFHSLNLSADRSLCQISISAGIWRIQSRQVITKMPQNTPPMWNFSEILEEVAWPNNWIKFGVCKFGWSSLDTVEKLRCKITEHNDQQYNTYGYVCIEYQKNIHQPSPKLTQPTMNPDAPSDTMLVHMLSRQDAHCERGTQLLCCNRISQSQLAVSTERWSSPP